MENDDNAANASEVSQQAEVEQHERDDVVDEHLPEVFALDVCELWDQEGVVEGDFYRVVEVDIGGDFLFRIVDPVVVCVPNPFFL